MLNSIFSQWRASKSVGQLGSTVWVGTPPAVVKRLVASTAPHFLMLSHPWGASESVGQFKFVVSLESKAASGHFIGSRTAPHFLMLSIGRKTAAQLLLFAKGMNGKVALVAVCNKLLKQACTIV